MAIRDVVEADLTDLEGVSSLPDLATVLRQLRRRHARRHHDSELTVRELAARTGYSSGAISEYLNGRALAPVDRFDVLVRLLGASPAEQGALATARDRVEEHCRLGRTTGKHPRELPLDVRRFTGRDDQLAELDRLVDRDVEAPNVVVLAGTAGVGKTALSVHWAYRVRDRFPDGCLFMDLRGYHPDQPVTPGEALAAFLRSLGVRGPDIPHDEGERAARYRTMLADRRMLVLLDNARDGDQVRPLLPGGTRCLVVITSRDALTGLVATHGAHRVNLAPLPLDLAVTLLGALIGRRVHDEPDAAAAIAQRCARLPLTLRLAANLAVNRPTDVLAVLADELGGTNRLDQLDAGRDQRAATRAVFSWSYRNLTAQAARAFRLIGRHPGHDVDRYTMAALAGVGLDRAGLLLRELANAHLISPTGSDRYGMHDLLRTYAAEQAADDLGADLTGLLGYYLYTCASATKVLAPFERDQLPRVAEPGTPTPELSDPKAATGWLDAERANLVAAAVYAADHGMPTHTRQLSTVLHYYLDNGGYYHEAELLHTCALNTSDNAESGRSLENLGTVHWRMGNYRQALDHYRRAHDIAAVSAAHAMRGRALRNLGVVHWRLGDVTAALDSYRQALDLARQAADRTTEGSVLGNLGIAHWGLGRYNDAIDCYRRAVDLMRRAGDHATEGVMLGNLGCVYERLGRFQDALHHQRRALDLTRETGNRRGEGQVLDNLARVYERLGNLPAAIDHGQQALDIAREIDDRVNEGHALNSLGIANRRLGQQVAAIDHHRQALDIAEQTGDDHLAGESLNGLGEALADADRPTEAVDRFTRAVAITSRTDNRYQLARGHDGLARTLTAAGRPAAASVHRGHALALYRKLGVPGADEVRRPTRDRG